jgi:hypothetical protein
MDLVDYLKSVRMTDAERKLWNETYGTVETLSLLFPAHEVYEAHSHHAEYDGARH